MFKNIKKEKGFSLTEVLVSLTIFVLFVSSATGVFVSITRHQRRFLIKQEILNQSSYNIELMSRAIRMAKKDTIGSCISSGHNYSINQDKNSIKFINHMQGGECQRFFLEDGQIKHERGKEVLTLTSSKFNVTNLYFKILNKASQPMIVINFEVEKEIGEDVERVNVQTTVSQRNLNVDQI